jgi:hypothetical protein
MAPPTPTKSTRIPASRAGTAKKPVRFSTPPAGTIPSAASVEAVQVEAARITEAAAETAMPGKAPEPAKALKSPKDRKSPKASRPAKPPKRQKLVRDSFTMPRDDYALIAALKERIVAVRQPTRKSELLRAGLHALMALPDARLVAALEGLAPLKPGRPRKSG